MPVERAPACSCVNIKNKKPVSNEIRSQEMFTWLLAVNEDQHKDLSSDFGAEGVRALWSWTIRSHSTAGHKDGADEVKGKLTSRFEVLKDEVQSVFPIIKVQQ